jgi:DNA repair protein RadD
MLDLIPFSFRKIGKMDYYGFELKVENPFALSYEQALFIDGQGFVQHNSGKSVVIANFAKKIHSNVLILSPSKEILMQNYKKLLLYVPKNQVGIYSASFNSKQVKKFTFATIGSIYKKPSLFYNFGIMIIDEVHLMNPKNMKSMYSSFIDAVGKMRKAPVKVFGLTATPYRNMQGYHKDKYGVLQSSTTLKLINRIQPKFWERIIHNVSVKELMDQGYLSPLKYENRLEFDHRKIPQNKSGSDFDLHKFSIMLSPYEKRIMEDIREMQSKHKSVLVFCSWVKDAIRYSEILKGSTFVHGKTKPKDRDKIIADFKSGKIKVVFNVGVLTTGFDHPELDAIVLLRPTRSLGLFYQIVGRGLRIAPGKTHCTAYDYTSNVENLGRIETIELVKKQTLLDHKPMWHLETERGSFHNKALYEFTVEKKEATNGQK